MYVAGIDVGSVAAKAVVLEVQPLQAQMPPRVVGRAVLPTGWNTAEAGEYALEKACTQAAVERGALQRVTATGYGRIALPFADKAVTEISCHARGAAQLFPQAGLVLDIGGQDSKVISLEMPREARGGKPGGTKPGAVRDFLMNDKCAAGTGRFLQVLSGILNMPLDELGRAASTGNPVAISSMCAVFAETEIVGLLARSTPPQDIAAGVFRAIARRMCALARRIPMQGQCVFTGGLATSPAFAAILSDELGLTVNVPDDPQTVGALGAALIAADWLERNSRTAVASI
ncbi:MAG: 2-hydroxyglutaryl-CoA dehydratase [Desulfovibrio sp.]|uniref:acyl-CoA dehydratase activase n=1 Tax=Desulfovibrio sp. TaxID=885 RepID=UPI00135D8117|nr:acyl-CoA dehydratase activase [Desulfovibrio sp.]MTJ93008.1 2-hydroxyglutaryl-CoA dehydratase [Desulfovibrio sp.]